MAGEEDADSMMKAFKTFPAAKTTIEYLADDARVCQALATDSKYNQLISTAKKSAKGLSQVKNVRISPR